MVYLAHEPTTVKYSIQQGGDAWLVVLSCGDGVFFVDVLMVVLVMQVDGWSRGAVVELGGVCECLDYLSVLYASRRARINELWLSGGCGSGSMTGSAVFVSVD